MDFSYNTKQGTINLYSIVNKLTINLYSFSFLLQIELQQTT